MYGFIPLSKVIYDLFLKVYVIVQPITKADYTFGTRYAFSCAQPAGCVWQIKTQGDITEHGDGGYSWAPSWVKFWQQGIDHLYYTADLEVLGMHWDVWRAEKSTLAQLNPWQVSDEAKLFI